MKKNGFMLAEVLIVSTLLIGVMVFMYSQIRTLTINYNKSFKYNTVEGLYGARIIRDFLETENNYKTVGNPKFVERNSINNKDYFDKITEELGITKIITTNNSKAVYSYLKNNYDNAASYQTSAYNGQTNYYESLITFASTLTENGNHIIIAYDDDTYCDYKY